MNVTFIGLGIMGSRMATHLIQSDISLTVFNRDSSKAKDLVSKGAKLATGLEDAVKEAEIVFTMLSKPEVVKEVAEVFLPFMNKGALWVDCTTVAPSDAREFSSLAAEQKVNYLEAPVAGTKQPAEKGELVFFVGGESGNLSKVEPLLTHMGKKTVAMGDWGNAAAVKLVVNLMLAQSMVAFAEAVKLGKAMGLKEELVTSTLLNVPVTAPFLKVIENKLGAKDTSPNFPLQWMHKDLSLVEKAAAEFDTPMPLAKTAKRLYEEALESGLEDTDFSTIFHYLNETTPKN